MKFKEIRPLLEKETVRIFEVFPAFTVLRGVCKDSEYDDYEVSSLSALAQCRIDVYLKRT